MDRPFVEALTCSAKPDIDGLGGLVRVRQILAHTVTVGAVGEFGDPGVIHAVPAVFASKNFPTNGRFKETSGRKFGTD